MHGCLLLGAVFMLACLMAVVFLPPLSPEEIDRDLFLLLPDGSDGSGGADDGGSGKGKGDAGGGKSEQKGNGANAGGGNNKKGSKGSKWEKKKKR